MQILVLYFNFWNPSGNGGKNLQLLERVNREEDNVSKLLYVLSFFGAMYPNMKYTLCKTLFFISTSEIRVVKGKKNLQLLEHVNGKEDNVSKLLISNILFTICWDLKSYNTKAQNSTVGKPHIKGVELTIREKDSRPKSIKKDLKPKTHKGIGLRKTKERKEEA